MKKLLSLFKKDKSKQEKSAKKASDHECCGGDCCSSEQGCACGNH